ncbi:hypothetical protein ACFE04_022006 [Oxalis oulophora]
MLDSIGILEGNYGLMDTLFDCSFEDFEVDLSFSSESYTTYNNSQNSFGQEPNNFSSSPMETTLETCVDESRRPTKQLKTNSWTSNGCTTNNINDQHHQQQQQLEVNNSVNTSTTSSNSLIISFGSKVVKPKNEVVTFTNQNCNKVKKNRRVASSRSPLHALDHVIAERKRREKLNQRFIALSAVIPGLTKTDKASVLEDAITYLKELQQQVKTLEEQAAKKTVESTVFNTISHFSIEDNEISLSDNDTFDSRYSLERPLREIEARIQNKDVLIRIHCENSGGCILKLLEEIEKFHLTIVNASILPFGNFVLNITIIAKMDNEFSMTAEEIVRSLRQT